MSALRDVASPCTGICRLDPTATMCVGCLRTLDEIAAWSSLKVEEKQALLVVLAERRRAHAETPQAD